MCGEIETEESLAEEFYARFVSHAQAFLAELSGGSASGESGELYAHLDRLFRGTLGGAVDQDNAPANVSGFQRLCMEPLVYARVAGYMAAHQPLEDDPLRRVIEALMTGYAEGEAAADSDHECDHGHSHGHTH